MDKTELIDNFSILDDWEDKYAYLISLGKILPVMPEELKTEETRVKGCVSQVWMVLHKKDDGCIEMFADSDAQIVRGLVAVLFILLNGRRLAEVQEEEIRAIFTDIGLDQHLSPNRRNGFYAMLGRIEGFIQTNS